MITEWGGYAIAGLVTFVYVLYLRKKMKQSHKPKVTITPAEGSIRLPDALWSRAMAGAFIAVLFNNPIFLAVAQGTIGNHGQPVDLKKYKNNFGSIIQCWTVSPPKPVYVE